MNIVINNKQLNVKLARTPEEQMRGLSNLESLLEDEGLLFVYPKRPLQHYFNTLKMKFSIDILCINNYMIVDIRKNIEPGILFIVLKGANFVLEINGGLTEKNKWEIGTLVEGLDNIKFL